MSARPGAERPASGSVARVIVASDWAAIQRCRCGPSAGWNSSPLRELSAWATRQSVRSTRPRGSIDATTLRLSPRESADESGVWRRAPSLSRAAAAAAAIAPRATGHRLGRAAGASASAAIRP